MCTSPPARHSSPPIIELLALYMIRSAPLKSRYTWIKGRLEARELSDFKVKHGYACGICYAFTAPLYHTRNEGLRVEVGVLSGLQPLLLVW